MDAGAGCDEAVTPPGGNRCSVLDSLSMPQRSYWLLLPVLELASSASVSKNETSYAGNMLSGQRAGGDPREI